VADTRLDAAPDAGLTVVLAVRPGLDADQLRALLAQVRARLAGSELLAERADALALTVVRA
jgi:hypothetical protein